MNAWNEWMKWMNEWNEWMDEHEMEWKWDANAMKWNEMKGNDM